MDGHKLVVYRHAPGDQDHRDWEDQNNWDDDD